MKSVIERNKEIDFKILERASGNVLDKLRADEANSDLYDQFQYRPDISGCQRYFIEPYKTMWGSQVEYSEFIPLPQHILEQYSNIECASFMGILQEINRVWVTVDNKLYIWNYYHPEDVQVFENVSEVIVSVSLSAPKPGVFLDSVKYVLIVATPIEVAVLAVSCDEELKNLKLIPTLYKLPSDNVTMFKITGSQSGRVFMAGNDGNLYELDYSNASESWAATLGVAPPNKCRKINHFAWNWKLVDILPPFLRNITGSTSDSLAELVVDNVRNVMYVATTRGVISTFYLGTSGKESHFVVRAFNLFEECRNFLSRSAPESSPRADSFSEANVSAPGFMVVGMFVIPLVESRKAHLLVVLGNGIRVYLSLFTTQGSIYSRIPSNNPLSGFAPTPCAMEVVYVRSPPSQTAVKLSNVLQQCVGVEDASGDPESGSVPTFVPSQPLRVGSAMYSHGTLLLSLDMQKQPDQLLAIHEDHLLRSPTGALQTQGYQPPSLKEAISVVLDASNNGGKIYDIKEDCSAYLLPEVAEVCALFAHSNTPTASMVGESSHHHQGARGSTVSGTRKSDVTHPPSDVPVTHSHALAKTPQFGRHGQLGYDRDNLDQLTVLSELCRQNIPSGTVSLQRQFLVLTNQGLHVFKKVRPVDVLYRNLAQLTHRGDELARHFFSVYNPLQASAMCISVACGLPCDAGGAQNIDPTVFASNTNAMPLETVQTRALNAMFALTAGPTHKGALVGNNLLHSSVKDSRLVFSGTSQEFVFSVAHDAFYLTVSRVLRPVWLRPMLYNYTVDSMWTVPLIVQIRSPLLQLLSILRGYFPVAVASDPNKTDFLAALENTPSDHLVTKQLLANAQAHATTEKSLQQQAKSLEDSSINSLYRLVSRVTHALSLIEILLTMHDVWHFPVDWTKLGNISFRSLVISPKVHERVKKLLNGMVTQMSRSDKTQIADRSLDWLSSECYHYFSAGDRNSFEASRLVDTIRRLTDGDSRSSNGAMSESGDLRDLSSRAVQFLQQAAQYWNTLESVVGDTSELSQRCNDLLELGQVGRDGVVSLCLQTANNFIALPASGVDRLTGRIHSLKSVAELDQSLSLAVADNSLFDLSLYHGGSVLSDSDRNTGTTACYSTLVQIIQTVGRDVPKLGEGMASGSAGSRDRVSLAAANMQRMIQYAVQHCSDDLFHDLLYSALLEDGQEQQLFGIRSPYIESFLRERDCTKLYSYYEHHGEFMKASNLVSLLAHQQEDLDISLRIAYLQKAVASAEKAVASSVPSHVSHPSVGTPSVASSGGRGLAVADLGGDVKQLLSDNLVELRDTLDIAEYQLVAHGKLAEDFGSYGYSSANTSKMLSYTESQRRQLDLMERAVHRLRYQLLGITELFHEVCLLYKLWDVCLLLLHISKHEDHDLIARLWRSHIYRLVPESGSSEEVNNFLRMKRDPNRLDVDKRLQKTGVAFEAAEQWLPALKHEVLQLGQALQGSASSAAFPVLLLLDELEELAVVLAMHSRDTLQLNVSPSGWVAALMQEVGLTHGALVEMYMQLFDVWAGKAPEKLVHVLAVTTAVLLSWTKDAIEHNSASAHETRQLLQAARSGRVRSWLEKLRRHCSTVSNSRGVSREALEQLGELSNGGIVEVNRRVNELTFV